MDKVTEDDGSLSFLNIKRDENNRSFNCGETTQSQIVNTTFWVVDFLEDVPTRFSKAKGTKGQTLVKINLRGIVQRKTQRNSSRDLLIYCTF